MTYGPVVASKWKNDASRMYPKASATIVPGTNNTAMTTRCRTGLMPHVTAFLMLHSLSAIGSGVNV